VKTRCFLLGRQQHEVTQLASTRRLSRSLSASGTERCSLYVGQPEIAQHQGDTDPR
jgi:hypothetical protein